jgi:hypothetical protein
MQLNHVYSKGNICNDRIGILWLYAIKLNSLRYFLHCPLFAAPRLKLLSSTAYFFADMQVGRND